MARLDGASVDWKRNLAFVGLGVFVGLLGARGSAFGLEASMQVLDVFIGPLGSGFTRTLFGIETVCAVLRFLLIGQRPLD
jgi:hypothetical protein